MAKSVHNNVLDGAFDILDQCDLMTACNADATIIKDATGQYSKQIIPDEVGLWRYRWVGTGTVIAANVSKFRMTSI